MQRERPPPAPSAGFGLAAALLLAFGGGLLLNLMPCVFPILAIKVLGVVQQAHGDPARLRTHGLLFALGVVLSFWAIAGLLLALRAGGTGLGWGYQLQSPVIVGGLAVLFFVLALNLSGVFQIGTGLQALAGGIRARGEHADALLSGLLATLVASPCTAPFMGAALGFALVQPAPHAMLVFTALAAGNGPALRGAVLCSRPHPPPAASRRVDGYAQAGARLPALRDGGMAGLGARTAGRHRRRGEAAGGAGGGRGGAVGGRTLGASGPGRARDRAHRGSWR